MNRAAANRGFTLTELLIVIALLGILVGIGLMNYSGARQRAMDSAAQQHGAVVALAVQQYLSQSPTRTVSALSGGWEDCTQAGRLSSPLPSTPDRGYQSGDIGWKAPPDFVTCTIGGSGRQVAVITGTRSGTKTYLNGDPQ